VEGSCKCGNEHMGSMKQEISLLVEKLSRKMLNDAVS
jgi:hypothetical protein